ncbi:unnamed protein product [Scytosiphon promiscuus]
MRWICVGSFVAKRGRACRAGFTNELSCSLSELVEFNGKYNSRGWMERSHTLIFERTTTGSALALCRRLEVPRRPGILCCCGREGLSEALRFSSGTRRVVGNGAFRVCRATRPQLLPVG